jgi:thymidylate synthase (FAD)
MTLAFNPADIQFRSDVTVEIIKSQASDADVVFAARVSTMGEMSRDIIDEDPERSRGLIAYLARSRHGSVFEHSHFVFYCEAPIFVFREFMRHRIGWSYNESSARYRELAPVFYVPAPDRSLVQIGKAGHYTFVPGSDEQYLITDRATREACTAAYVAYREILDAGVAREVARGVLPVATYSSMYATCNARSLMSFLSLRTNSEESTFPSYPQREIAMVAEKMEVEFARMMPITHKAFVDSGRVAP